MPEQVIVEISTAERTRAAESRNPTPSTSPVRLREMLCVMAVSAAYLFPFTRLLHRIGDEGTIVYGAQRVLEGAVPYRDFVEVMGPGSFYWLAMFFHLFGDSWQVSRLCLWVTAVSATILLYWIARQYLNRASSSAAALFFAVMGIPLWPAPNHHLDSNLFALGTVASFICWAKAKRAVYLWLAGTLAGLTTCFVQPKGSYLFAALLLIILFVEKKRKILKPALVISGSYLAVGAIVLGFFYHAGALQDLIYCTFRWPLSGYHAVNSGIDWHSGIAALAPAALYASVLPFWLAQLFLAICLIPFSLLLVLPIIACVAAMKFVWRERVASALTLLLPALTIWLSEIHRKDLFHFAYGAPLLIVVSFLYFNSLPSHKLRAALIVLISLALVLVAMGDLWNVRRGYPIQTRRGTILDAKQDDALLFLNTEIPKGEQVFVYPYYPMYYWLADLRNPTRFSILMYDYNTRAHFDEVIRDLEAKRVKFVLWDSVVDGANLRTWFPAYRQPAAGELKLEHYLISSYDLISVKNGFRILRRK